MIMDSAEANTTAVEKNPPSAVVLPDDSHCTNVYVANLPPSADATKIRELFAGVGRVLHVKLLLDIATGVSRGIAFVMFEDLATARKACVLKNKVVLDGAVLQVRLAERSALHSSVEAHPRSNIVYIRNVPGPVGKDVVRQHCERAFGPVLDVVPHPQSCELSGPSPYNMVFVTFESVDDACRCVEGVDGKTPFQLPHVGHPFAMAKMIADVGGEMRKSILLRRRSSDAQVSPQQQALAQPAKLAAQQQQHHFAGMGMSPQGMSLIPHVITPPQSPHSSTLTPQARHLQPPPQPQQFVFAQAQGGFPFGQQFFVPPVYHQQPQPQHIASAEDFRRLSQHNAFSLEGPPPPPPQQQQQQRDGGKYVASPSTTVFGVSGGDSGRHHMSPPTAEFGAFTIGDDGQPQQPQQLRLYSPQSAHLSPQQQHLVPQVVFLPMPAMQAPPLQHHQLQRQFFMPPM